MIFLEYFASKEFLFIPIIFLGVSDVQIKLRKNMLIYYF
jgi:hypothetical protein